MDLRQLAALTAVADHQSFSAAARALHTVQSNVSAHVAHLEQELGATLVDRTTGLLTEAGGLVVIRARRIQAELEAVGPDVASSIGVISGTVRLGVIGTTGRWLIPPLLRSMQDTHAKVRLITVDATTTSLVPQLSAGTLDLAVVNLPVVDPDVDIEALFEEDHVLLAPHDHALAGSGPHAIEDLANVPLLLEPPGTGFRDDLDADAQRAGITLVAQAEVDGMRLLASLAYQGFGAAILPASAIVDSREGAWQRVGLDGFTPRSVGVATHRRAHLTTPARATLELLREVIDREVPGQQGLHLRARPPDTAHGEPEAATD